MALFFGGCVQKGDVSPMEEAQTPKIAMILPQKRIGRYAHTTSTAVFAYFLSREHPFVFKSFVISDETPEEIERVLDEISDEDFEYVIAPVTPKGARNLVESGTGLTIFFPTIHRNDLETDAQNIYFGAIDYKGQIDRLTELAHSPLVIMYDQSAQGKKLLKMTEESYRQSGRPYKGEKEQEIITYGIDKQTSNLAPYLESNEKIQSGSFFLNTPLVKSAMILSQLSYYNTDVTNILSTQINYDPLIISMTQKKDRENLYIANSVTVQDDPLVEANSMLSNDIVYDWINYASTVGADYFYHRITQEPRIYALPMIGNQISYPISIVKAYNAHFKVFENE
jgi:hypothetical protein